jgi:hypothetical protein
MFQVGFEPMFPVFERVKTVNALDGSATMIDFRDLTYGAEPFLRSCQLCSHSGTSQHFKEPESSSPCSQEPSTGPYPEPVRSSPYHPILSLSKIHFNTPTYVFVFLVVSFLLVFPPISYMHSSSPPFVLHTLPTSFSIFFYNKIIFTARSC